MTGEEMGWLEIDGSWYYYLLNGTKATGWKKIDGDWYYFYNDGSMAWGRTVDGYFLNTDGKWVSSEGWQQDEKGTYYYVGSDEKVVKGWNNIGDDFHYFNYPGGSMTWDNTIDGFYLDNDGKMVSGTGWQNVNGDWYYFYSDGEMATGWINDGNGWYYLYSNGSMTWDNTIDGYHVDKSGKMVTGTGWQCVDGSWYYLDGNGEVETNGQLIDGLWYYFYTEGSMAWNTTVDGYYLNKDGAWVPNGVADSNNDEINSLPEYDPLSARLKENKGTRAKKKGANGEYFAGTIDEFGNFIPDDIEVFTNVKINNDPTSTGSIVGGFFGGALDNASNQIEGAWDAVNHPIDTAENLGKLVIDKNYREQAVSNIRESINNAYEDDVRNGDPTTAAHFWGEVASEIGTLFFTDGAGEGAKTETVTNAADNIVTNNG